MFTEKELHKHPSLIRAFMGLPAEIFWQLIADIQTRLSEYEAKRLARPTRRRAMGGGRTFDQPLVIRVALVLTYLRLHIIQEAVAGLYGATQSDVSRELRRLLPLLAELLPSPEVWEVVEDAAPPAEPTLLAEPTLPAETALPAETTLLPLALADGRALVDATEQQVYRPQDSAEQKAFYSGKKKQFTLKTQFVTDGEHHIEAISISVPGATHDKTLCDRVQTLDHLPDGTEVDADKGYQGLAKLVDLITVRNAATGVEQQIPRLLVQTPFKKPKGGELTAEQNAFNLQLSRVRVRVEHCIGWVKNWAIIATRFRCAHGLYTLIMQVVCGLVNGQTQRWQAAKTPAVA